MGARTFVVIASLAVAPAIALGQEKPKIEQAPIPRVSPVDAKEMFNSYCSVCHGPMGRGNGPAAAALKKAPADLTTISARNGGKFPEIQVRRYIEGLDEVAAHGSREMPIWGPLFRSLNRDTAALRVEGLANYLKSVQQ
ncbi:MAG: c-type cytochrome [Acidobacteriota bacterium]